MKTILNEESLKNLVKETTLKALNESFLMNKLQDKLQDKRSTEANTQMKLKQLKTLLLNVGIDNLTPKTVHGDVGYIFTCPMNKAVAAAKQLKADGVAFKKLKQDGYYNDDEIWDATLFAYFGPYPMMEGKVSKTV